MLTVTIDNKLTKTTLLEHVRSNRNIDDTSIQSDIAEFQLHANDDIDMC
jgi:hypothetical protein